MTAERVCSQGSAAEDWMVPGIILAVTEHRRRIAKLLRRLDDLRRTAVETGVAALEDGTVDAATLLVRFSERLRVGDGQLEQLVADLESQRRTHGSTAFPRKSEMIAEEVQP